ncbi:hypothetical protein N2152v2_002585 [Parachlorella kessleri]
MALDTDSVTAVQAALEEAQTCLQDLELSFELQRQEFFGSNASSVASSEGDEVDAMKQPLELQVLQLTERLQQLKDAQLAQVLHEQLLAEASRAARDRQLAAAIGDRQDEGPSGRQFVLTFEADMKVGSAGPGGFGAVITSPAGEVLWEGNRAMEATSLQQALLAAAAEGLQAAVGLGLETHGASLVLQSSHVSVLDELMGGGRAQSSTAGGLLSSIQGYLGRFPRWRAQRARGEDVARAARLAREALWPSCQPARPQRAQQQVSSRSEVPLGTDNCAICLEDVPATSFHVIDAQDFLLARVGACLHRFCKPCLRQHAQVVVKARRFPVPCPHVGCDATIATPECKLLLAASDTDVAMYKQVEAEASIPEVARLYCPNPHCSAPFHLEGEPAPNSPQICPACSHKIFPYCRVVWHKGFSCVEYQALPTTERQPEDLAVLREAQRRRWCRCAQCRHMIELGEGCRHMTCKCGYEFWYACGKPWQKGLAALVQALRQDFANGNIVLATEEGVPFWVPAHIRPQYKTRLCMYFEEAGGCRRGGRCWFAHGPEELRTYRPGGSVPGATEGSYSSDDGYASNYDDWAANPF